LNYTTVFENNNIFQLNLAADLISFKIIDQTFIFITSPIRAEYEVGAATVFLDLDDLEMQIAEFK
jgi:hypothetical protein